MADRHLTISEAEKFTGKSRSTLRRFIDGIVKADDSPDRALIIPPPDEARAFKAQNQPFAWRISEELLRRQFLRPVEEQTGSSGAGSGGLGASDSARLVAVLEKSIAILERELTEKNTQIASMNERLREGNILLKDLQARLALPPGNPPQTVAVESKSGGATEPKPRAKAKEKEKSAKRSFWWPLVR